MVAAIVPARGDFVESFDGWTSKTAYSGLGVYSNASSGVWAIQNALCNTQNERSGRAVRFANSSTPAPYLEYRGLSGQGITGLISEISFYYRHWDADGNNVQFVLQTSSNGTTWTSVSATQIVTSTTYQQFVYTNTIHAEGLFVRVQSVAYAERLLIDDFSMTINASPLLSFVPGSLSLGEAAGTARVWAVMSSPGEATADVVIAGGSATPDIDFAVTVTSLIFSASSMSQAVDVAILDDLDSESNETLILSITNTVGVVPSASASFATITIIDDEQPSLSFVDGVSSASESASLVSIPVVLSDPADATVSVHVAGTAWGASDVTIAVTDLVFSVAGSVTQTIEVVLVDDGEGEPDEFLDLTLVDARGANVLAPASHRLTIIDNEPLIWLEPADIVLEEGGPGIAIQVVISTASSVTATIAVAGAAFDANDVLLSETLVVFSPASSTTQTVYLSAPRDGIAEGPEQGVLTFVQVDGAYAGTNPAVRVRVRDSDAMMILAANLTSGNDRLYLDPGMRLLDGLMPDVVAIQEFAITSTSRRAFVDAVFGTNFYFMVEPGSGSIPNGIISRWPIMASGEWNDPYVSDRDFAWATIDIPGPRPLHVVSAHLYASGTATDRNGEAQLIVQNAQAQFAADDYLVIAGDLNAQDRGEPLLLTLAALVSDAIQPADQLGNRNTNRGRNKPLDFVLPNARLESRHVPLALPPFVFSSGMVFDSRLWTNPPAPIRVGDSDAENMQHMAVAKLFAFPTGLVLNARFDRLVDQGNGNGLFETNESVAAYIQISNEGALIASNLLLTVESLSPSLVLSSAYSFTVSDLPVAGVVTSEPECVFHIPAEASAGDHPVRVVVTADDVSFTNQLIIPVFINRIEEALDTTNVVWSLYGSWEYQTNITYDGVDALRSDVVPANSVNWIETVVEGPGVLSYAWSLRSTGQPGYLLSHLDYQSYQYRFSSSSWIISSNIIPSGVHTMRWEHINTSSTATLGTGLLDRVVFQAYTNPVLITSPSLISRMVREQGEPFSSLIAVQNIGTDQFAFNATSSVPWMSADVYGSPVTNGLYQYGYIDVLIRADGLPPGTYTGLVIVVAPTASPPAATTRVVLAVSGPVGSGPGETNLIWWSMGNQVWNMQTNVTRASLPASRSGLIGHNQTTSLETDVFGPGTLAFWWKVSSEQDYDYLRVYVNDIQREAISGEINWQLRQYNFTAGVHRVRWSYTKDGSVTNGLDAAFVSEVTMTGVPDRDADGIPDGWEIRYFGSATGAQAFAHSDDDGFSDYEEYIADTDPTNSTSRFDGVVDVYFESPLTVSISLTSTQRFYDLYAATNLIDPSWEAVVFGIAGSGSNRTVTVTNTPDQYYFRSGVRLP